MALDRILECRFYYDENRFAEEDLTKAAGWRVIPRYQPNVLTGNWSEERYSFLKYPTGPVQRNSTHRADFGPYDLSVHKPDRILQRKGLVRNEGHHSDMLTRHHGDAYNNNMVSIYDEQFNGRWREKNLPPLRTWNSKYLAWLPERSDHHVQHGATNFGLLPDLQKKWKKQQDDQVRCNDYLTNYTKYYQNYSPEAYKGKRYGIPKEMSSRKIPAAETIEIMKLRNKPSFRLPEFTDLPQHSIPEGTPLNNANVANPATATRDIDIYDSAHPSYEASVKKTEEQQKSYAMPDNLQSTSCKNASSGNKCEMKSGDGRPNVPQKIGQTVGNTECSTSCFADPVYSPFMSMKSIKEKGGEPRNTTTNILDYPFSHPGKSDRAIPQYLPRCEPTIETKGTTILNTGYTAKQPTAIAVPPSTAAVS